MLRLFDIFKNNKTLVVLILIVLLGAVLRTWNLGDWMHYQLDQARDFRIIHAAIKYGPGELPLQGPKAAGNVIIADSEGNLTDKTTLRLGPALYYLEYLSALLFGDTPTGSIVVIALFSIATLPLFYLILRRFFDVRLSLGLTALAAAGVFLVSYGRFGWNPNLIAFFMALLVYALLRLDDDNPRYRGCFLVLAALALALVGQMHFLAFVTAPIIAGVYLLWTRPRVMLRYWLAALALFSFIQTPLIINDFKTGGENVKAFLAAVRGKSEAKEHSLLEKLVRNTGNHAKYFWLINTGDQRAELPKLRHRDIRCDQSCRDGLLRGGVSLAMIVSSLAAWVIFYRRERDIRRKNFLRLILLWVVVPFIVYIPLAYDMAPRFYLVSALGAIIFLGLMLQIMMVSRRKFSRRAAYVVLFFFILSNLFFVGQYFSQLARAATDPTLRIPTDYILKEKTRTTLEQTEAIIDYIEEIYNRTGKPVFLHSQAEYKRAFWERLDYYGIPRFHAPKDLSRAYRDGNYFLVVRTQTDIDKSFGKIFANADVLEKKVFGTLTVYRLRPKEENLLDKPLKINVNSRDPKFSSSAQVRYLWRQVWE